MITHTLETDGATITYDVHDPATPTGARTLVMIGQPMPADGFAALAARFTDRRVVTYDPRGLGRSVRHDGGVGNDPTQQAHDVHALISTLHDGPVDLFASSGGAVTGLALVSNHPGDVATLVAHEPPLITVLPDIDAARRARAGIREAYERGGWGAGMAAFIAMTSWRGRFDAGFLEKPAPSPASFGLPTEDDGTRVDPLLSDRSWAINDYQLDREALAKTQTDVQLAYGEESEDTFCARAAAATAELLDRPLTIFPSHHGGFSGPESGYPGKPDAFAQALRKVLARGRGAAR